jgi:protein O-GlcNAc transferase
MQAGHAKDTLSGRQSAGGVNEDVSADTAFEQAGRLHTEGKFDEAEQLYRAILECYPHHFGSLHNLGILCFQRGRYDDTVTLAREVVRLKPELAVPHNTLGVALRHLGRLNEAEAACREALRRQPDYAEAYNTLADVLIALHRWREAEACCREALRLAPSYAEAHNNLGTVLAALGCLEEAEACCRESLRIKPNNAAALNNLGTALLALGRPQEAEACWRAVVRLQPGEAQAHNNLATALLSLGRAREAEACCREALRIRPGHPEAIYNLAIALSLQHKLSEAAGYFAQTTALKPGDADTRVGWIYMRQQICDWSRYREDEARIRKNGEEPPTPGAAFRLLGYRSTLEEQLAYARRVAARVAVPKPAMLPRRPPRPAERIRLGYFSANFHFHPVATLIAGLIEQHNRRRFEVIAYSFDEDDGSAMRRRLVRAFDRFVDISNMPDRDAAQLIHTDAIDILVDLHGWTPDGRAAILAYRPAPIQVSYLGFAGTSGADFIDYIVADRFVIPPEERCFFSEHVAYLPDCFLPSDDKREIAARTLARGAYSLPEHGFVFCCFNNSWKLNPELFDIWMRLLRAVPHSVLWLYEANPLMKANLAHEAETRGVAPERLVFAPRLPSHPEHLARYRVADLFLDTLPYNAHTTASDALWAGVPVLTCAGKTFAGRVAGSMLRAVGLSDLVTTSLDAYKASALRLARHPDLLKGLRARLAENRHIYPLFNTPRYVRNLEAAFRRMHEMRNREQSPAPFELPLPSES